MTLKRRMLTTSMLVAPAALMLATAQPALAVCTNPGSGTVGAPDDGDTVTCSTPPVAYHPCPDRGRYHRHYREPGRSHY